MSARLSQRAHLAMPVSFFYSLFGETAQKRTDKPGCALQNLSQTAAVVFVYDIHPLAQTLYDAYLSPAAQSAALRHPPRPGANPLQHFPERIFWSFAIQLSNAIKTVHDQKLAVRTVELSKILVTGQHRLRINGCGMLDVIRNDLGTEQALHQLQVRFSSICPLR